MNSQPKNDRPDPAESPLDSPSTCRQPALLNLVRYERVGGQGRQLTGCVSDRDVLYIDETTPLPILPPVQLGPPSPVRSSKEVVYIGPE